MRWRGLTALLSALPVLWAACSNDSPSSGGSSSTSGGSGSGGTASGGVAATTGGGGQMAANGGRVSPSNGGTAPSSAGTASDGGQSGPGQQAGSASDPDPLGAYPFTPSTVTRGGTMTFLDVGAPGWWPRRIEREAGDPACDYKDGTDTWGGHCCMKENRTASDALSPFDQEMTLILKAIDVKQLAVYQPDAAAGAPWQRVSSWDRRRGTPDNLWFTREGAGSASFSGELFHDDCVGYVMQAPSYECGDGRDYYCPNDPGILHRGFAGSKLVVLLGSMSFEDSGVQKCDGDGAGHPGPWVAFVASELVRDGGRKWNGLCNCYSKTGSVGDGCGEINVFEVVMDNNDFSNREFASTGVRSYQSGHVGGAVCGSDCDRDDFPADVEVVDACAGTAYDRGPELDMAGDSDGCPVWRRPDGDRYFFILLDQTERAIQVGIVHPENIPSALRAVLPEVPSTLDRAAIDALVRLRLPE